MNLSLLASMPAILFLKSMALLAVMFFYPYWALFYHHHYEYLMFASPWVLCLRKQCKLIKDLGQAEACQVTMLLSMLLSLPLGLSVPAQCVGILSAPLARLMPFYTSLMCLIIGSTELLAFLFFRLLLIQLKFLLREFSMWLNWPVYFLMFSSVVYFMAGAALELGDWRRKKGMEGGGQRVRPQGGERGKGPSSSIIIFISPTL
ncbi:uncharacterized protein [Notamacropus eugenii]|uniref:uncharacterized protein isoform X2 n=1 Tax=Notamacropus eugenii TaxID=9315 RepID=UPI003B6724F2